MSTGAMIMMLITEIFITVITVYFFWKVLKTPSKPEHDSTIEKSEKE